MRLTIVPTKILQCVKGNLLTVGQKAQLKEPIGNAKNGLLTILITLIIMTSLKTIVEVHMMLKDRGAMWMRWMIMWHGNIASSIVVSYYIHFYFF